MGCGASSSESAENDKNAANPTLVVVVGGSGNGGSTTKSGTAEPGGLGVPGGAPVRSRSIARMNLNRSKQEIDDTGSVLTADLLGGSGSGHSGALGTAGKSLTTSQSFRHRRRTIRMQEFSETVQGLVSHNQNKPGKGKFGNSLMPTIGNSGGSSPLSEDDDAEVRVRLDRLFALLDVDASGSISVDELSEGFKKLGWAHSPAAVSKLFGLQKNPTCKTGEIDKPTFDKLFRHLTSVDSLVVGEEMDAVSALELPAKPRREWKPGTRPIVGYKVETHQGHKMRVKCVSLSPTRRVYATCHREDTVLYLHDLDTGVQLRSFQGHQDAILCCVVSPDRKHIATAGRDGVLILFDATCGHILKQFEHPGVVTCCCFSVNGKQIFTGCHDTVLRKYDVAKGRMLAASADLNADDLDICSPTKGVVVTVAAGAKFVALSRAREKRIEVLDAENLKVRNTLLGHEGLVWALNVSNDTKSLVSTCEKFIRTWDLKSGYLARRWRIEDVRVGQPAPPRPPGGGALGQRGPAWITACFCPGDFQHILAAVCSDLTITLLHNVGDGPVLLTLFSKAPVYCLSASRDFTELGYGDEFGNVYRLTLW